MFKQRLLTGIVGGAVFVAAVWYGSVPFSLLIAFLAVVGYSELVRMKGFGRFSAPALLGYLVTLLYVFPEALTSLGLHSTAGDTISIFWLLMVLFLFLSISVATKNRYSFQDMTYLFAGTLYLGLPFQCFILLRGHAEHGLAYFLFVQLVIWTTDTFAYLIGRALKGPKIWPAISPNKTVSGSVGGVLGAILVGVIFANVIDERMMPWILLAVLLSVVGQLGDFVESGLKRALGVKDSGSLLPGHGGVLDRFDSFLFSAPIAYYVIMNIFA